jgi:hypothetical protein
MVIINGDTGINTIQAGTVTSSDLATSIALTGTPTAPTAAPGTNTTQLATTAYVTTSNNLKAPLSNPVFSTGGTFGSSQSAQLEIGVDTNTSYIDFHSTNTYQDYNARLICDGNSLLSINATNIAFNVTPTAPTVPAGTNNTQLATTAFVTSSPAFTGTPTAPTAAPGTNTTQLATTAFAKAEITAAVSGANVSLSANGYQKLPSGLIIQWGKGAAMTTEASETVTFPIAFPNTCLSVQCTTDIPSSSINGDAMFQIVSFTSSSIVVFKQGFGNAGTPQSPYFFAIGY